MIRCFPEDTLPLEEGRPSTSPDFTFDLLANRQRFRFFLEYDRRTERLQSLDDPDSIAAKVRRYDAWLSRPHDGRVLFVCDDRGSKLRATKIIQTATKTIVDERRELVYSVTAADFLRARNPAMHTICRSNRCPTASLIPKYEAIARRPFDLPTAWIAESLSLSAI